MQRNETDEDAAIGAGSEAGLNEDENDPDLSDDGLDLDDNASGVSSESSQSNAAPSDPRETQIVPGEFDPETGHIKCVAPPCPLSGIVLVQVAVDGSTFTTDEIFYIYTEPCTLQSAVPRAFSCAVEDRQQLRTITMEATGLYAMPEVCLRLSIPDTGKEFIVPATVRQQVPSSEEEDRELGLPADEVSADRKVQAETTFAMNEAIDALVGPEATSCVAEIAVSLNGISFASTAHLPESVRTCVLSRPCITHMFPRGLPCVAKSDSAIELGPIQLSVTGLVPEHTDAVRMRMKSLHDGAESSLQFELPAKTNAELTKVSFDAPRLGPDVLPNGQGWGLLPFEIAITFDDGQSWVTSSGPLVYFAGQLEAPRPLALPACGGELEISTSEEHAGWIYSEAEPIVAFSSPQRPSLPAVQSNQICITKESSLIVCSTGDLGDLYAKVREFMRQQLQAQILQEYLDENPLPEAPDDPEAEDDDARAARETATTEARQLAETHAAQEAARADLLPVELNVMVALNGRDFVHQFPGSLELFAHPQVTSVEPSEKLLTLASSDPADDSSPSAVADTDGGEPDEICTVQVTSPFSLPQVSARTTLRFTHRLLGHVHDVPARTPDSEDEEAGNTEASATSRTVQCTIPRFQHAGVYEISVALNGVDFPPYLEETLRSEDAEMQDENDLDGTAEAARNTFTVLEPPEDEDCKQ
ncbi:Hypothetical Protein FCC1311_058781 [Hondaea fermentalgiana]|uniref:Uncharacterized protein n=1 Tax=Hondaea fermentalgiana TaxID=2315210 RepID=A0A2R5G2A0_9STRA|nr:Hypothetical Protein FCC1311_058781 [Hondaea fermentalgiana]|eukprot:GBG25157.1 Hypothetical Protein FCC1311_058781 [Hondaea fermentalgiana]